MAEETKHQFGDADSTGPVASSPLLEHTRNGLRFFYAQPGHIVVPGLAGEHQPARNR